jgi:cytochrome c
MSRHKVLFEIPKTAARSDAVVVESKAETNSSMEHASAKPMPAGRLAATLCAAALASSLIFTAPVAGQGPKYAVGRAPTPEEIQAWDISIAPDGTGLPPGQGNAEEGAKIYQARCQECHGAEAKGGDEAPLVGGHETLATEKPLKTATGYWPYATILFDYTRRAMPFKDPGTLSDNQVYAVVAYLLALDGIIEKQAVMNAETLPKIEMPNRNGFLQDPRPGVEKLVGATRQ